MAEEREAPLPKPTVWDQLYPGRFLKAGELLGRKVTLTITDVSLDRLVGDDSKKKVKGILTFKETEKQLALCKTNGICIKAMFTAQLANWTGKRITLFEDTWNNEPCTRVWGSPDIPQDLEVEISLPRRRPFKKTMHKMTGRGAATGNGSGGKSVPSASESITALREADTLDTLVQTKNSVWAVYAAAKADIPVEVDAAYNERHEALEQAEQQTL
jgi:hypothetical protein